ncbi:MAG: lytic murein transglycosylase [Mesorhizobium sp.]|nr:MAG: lytic murein transglycosylase [Mesorhizobium sp.]
MAGQRPLWPAGHLAHLGGDRQLRRRLLSSAVVIGESGDVRPISPQVGEMPSGGKEGRTEGARRIANL